MTKKILVTSIALFTFEAFAGSSLKFSYTNTDVRSIVADYSKASGQKFIIDPSVRGQATILNSGLISEEEAFNQLSSALAVNGIGISKQGDTMVVAQARAIQRGYIEVGTEVPPLKPEKMFTWTLTLKNVSADEVNRQIRTLTSKDGELVPMTQTNQLIITDWVSNLHRVARIIEEIDKPGVSKFADEPQKAAKNPRFKKE